MFKEIFSYFNELRKGINIMFKEFFNKETNKKQRANMWTFSRLVISFLIPIFSILSIYLKNRYLFTISGIITGIGALTDFFDGRSARKYNSISEFGKKLDQFTDKVFSIMIGINLTLFYPIYSLIIIGEIIIILVTVPIQSKYKEIENGSIKIGKIKQWPLFISLMLGYLAPIHNILIISYTVFVMITFILQLITSIGYIIRNINNVKKLKNNLVK